MAAHLKWISVPNASANRAEPDQTTYTGFIQARTSEIQGLFKDKFSDFQGLVDG